MKDVTQQRKSKRNFIYHVRSKGGLNIIRIFNFEQANTYYIHLLGTSLNQRDKRKDYMHDRVRGHDLLAPAAHWVE